MKIKKFLRRLMYFVLAFLVVWAVCMQSGCFSMRTPDNKWAENLKKKGQNAAVHFIDVPNGRGRNLHTVSITTSDTLPWVLFVHGSPGASDGFAEYLADTVLSQHFNMIAFDRAGFGYSGFGHPETSLEGQAADMKAIADHFAAGKAIILLGHSLGGPLICRFAMDYPAQTRVLIDVAGSIDPNLEPHQWWVPVVDNPPVKWLIPIPLWTSNHEIRHLSDELNKMMPMWEGITCPVHLIHAEDDQLVSIGNVAFADKMLTHSSNRKETILPKGNHFILWSRMDVIKQALLEVAH
jgi:pimeloyl-ACP methyl ester carboxylesterase